MVTLKDLNALGPQYLACMKRDLNGQELQYLEKQFKIIKNKLKKGKQVTEQQIQDFEFSLLEDITDVIQAIDSKKKKINFFKNLKHISYILNDKDIQQWCGEINHLDRDIINTQKSVDQSYEKNQLTLTQAVQIKSDLNKQLDAMDKLMEEINVKKTEYINNIKKPIIQKTSEKLYNSFIDVSLWNKTNSKKTIDTASPWLESIQNKLKIILTTKTFKTAWGGGKPYEYVINGKKINKTIPEGIYQMLQIKMNDPKIYLKQLSRIAEERSPTLSIYSFFAVLKNSIVRDEQVSAFYEIIKDLGKALNQSKELEKINQRLDQLDLETVKAEHSYSFTH